ncbi:beta-1,3-galactosyl-O-glycosyl-glycoprotein beta-1,6-N-acetylglucosaminyltransferase 3 [Antennarius striatus]|uniref:beta-1,3-galactosyl-O-glycosyl-glycoprotein beta-1,6-N-acetylglucosaminyltransferase 3 n=1 Tax=Antennarius striatus TaxID=241820 RepID=UPI0035AD91C7
METSLACSPKKRGMLLARWTRGLCIILMSTVLFVLLWETVTKQQPRFEHRIRHQFVVDLPGCLAIIRGDAQGSETKIEALLASRTRKKALSTHFYLNETNDCKTYIAKRAFFTVPLSEEERAFPIAYSMVIHEKIEMFERLLRAIYAPQNVYCVHVDQKSPEEFKKAVAAIVSCFPNVFITSKLESVVYASWSRVQADLNCMKDLLASRVRWRYLLNTCGTDFPIKTNREMVQRLKALNGGNSMESESTSGYKKNRWMFHHNVTDHVVGTNVRKSPPPISTPMYSGNAYFVVSRAFVEYVMHNEEVQNLLEWEKDTYSPDEHLWATLQRMPSVPGSMPPNVKYDTSDMQAFARLVKWSYLSGDVRQGAPYPPCTGAYQRAVCVYGVGDIQWLLSQHHLLANKFDPEVDDTVIRCMESVLHFKALNVGLVF